MDNLCCGTYDTNRNKVLLDGNHCTVTGTESNPPLVIFGDGVKLRIPYNEKVLKKFNPKKFKAIVFQPKTTVITTMKIESFEMNPFEVGMSFPVVEVFLKGTPKTKFTD